MNIMKNKLILSIILLMVCAYTISSCKKTNPDITNAQLVGTWTEQAPCCGGVGSCFILQFTSSYHCYINLPDSPAYTLSRDSIHFINDQYYGSYKMSLTDDGILTIDSFCLHPYTLGGTLPLISNVILKKM